MATELATGYINLVPSARGFGRGLGRQLTPELGRAGNEAGRVAGDNASRSLGSRLASGVSGLGSRIASTIGTGLKIGMVTAGAAGAAALTKAVTGGVSRLVALENADKRLQQMGLSAQQTDGLMASLNKTLEGTPYALDAGASAMASFVSSGLDLDKIPGVLDMVADAAAFGQAPLNEVADIFNKVALNGKAQQDVLNELQYRGIPAMSLLSDALGMSGEEFSKFVSEGKLDADTFFTAWEEGAAGFGENNIKMAGAAKSAGDTTAGAWANMMTALSRFGAKLAGPIFNQAAGFFTAITGWVDAAGKAVERWYESGALLRWIAAIGGAVSTAIGAVSEAWGILTARSFTGVGPWAWDSPVVKALFAFREAVASVILGAREAWSLLVSGNFTGIGPWSEDSPVVAALLGFRRRIVETFGLIRDFVEPVLDRLRAAGSRVLDFIRGAWTATFGGATAIVAKFLGKAALGGLIKLFTGVLLPVLVAVGGALVSGLTSPLSLLFALGTAAVYAYRNFEPFRDVVDEVARLIVGGLAAAFDWVTLTAIPALIAGWGRLVAAFQSGSGAGFFGGIGAAARAAFDWIVNTGIPRLITGWEAIVSGARAVFGWVANTAIPWLIDGWGKLVKAFKSGSGDGLFGDIGETARTVFDWLVGTAIPGVQSAVKSFIDGLRGEGGEGSFFTDLGEAAVTVARWLQKTVLPAAKRLFDYLTGDGKPILIAIGVAFAAIAAPVATAIAAFVLAYQRFSWFRTAVAGILGAIRGYFENIWLPTFVFMWNAASTYFGLVSAYVSNVLLPVFRRIWGVASTVFNAVSTIVSFWWNNWMGPILRAVVAYVTNVLIPGWQRIWGVARAVFGAVSTIVTYWWNTVLGPIFRAVVGYVTGTLIPRLQALWHRAREVFDRVAGAARTMWAGVREKFEAFKIGAEAVRAFVVERFNRVVTFFGNLKDRVERAMGRVADAIKGPFETAFRAIRDLWNSTVGGFTFTIPDWVKHTPGGGLVAGKGFTIPEMHTGGVVPGRPGEEVLRMLEGGEIVLSRQHVADLAAAPAMASPPALPPIHLYMDGREMTVRMKPHLTGETTLDRRARV